MHFSILLSSKKSGLHSLNTTFQHTISPCATNRKEKPLNEKVKSHGSMVSVRFFFGGQEVLLVETAG